MDFLELPWEQEKTLFLTICNSQLVRFYVIYTLLTHTGRSRQREVGNRARWLLPQPPSPCFHAGSCGLSANRSLKRGYGVLPESLVLKIWPGWMKPWPSMSEEKSRRWTCVGYNSREATSCFSSGRRGIFLRLLTLFH